MSACTTRFMPKTSVASVLKHIHFNGVIDYERGSKIMEFLVKKNLARRNWEILKRNPRFAERHDASEEPASYRPTVLSFQFNHVYTGGRRERFRLGNEVIAQMDREKHVPFVQATRGGQVTYHGPGQVVVYPILSLSMFKGLSSKCYVSTLEKSVIGLLQAEPFGLPAKTTEDTGVWVDSRESYRGKHIKKISSLGVNVRHNVTSHGVSINCSTDLNFVNDPHFVMCGLPQYLQTSIKNELGQMPTGLEEVDERFAVQLASRLNIPTVETAKLDDGPTVLEQVDALCKVQQSIDS